MEGNDNDNSISLFLYSLPKFMCLSSIILTNISFR